MLRRFSLTPTLSRREKERRFGDFGIYRERESSSQFPTLKFSET